MIRVIKVWMLSAIFVVMSYAATLVTCQVWGGRLDGMTYLTVAVSIAAGVFSAAFWLIGVSLGIVSTGKGAFWGPLACVLASAVMALGCIIAAYYCTSVWDTHLAALGGPLGFICALCGFSSITMAIMAIAKVDLKL